MVPYMKQYLDIWCPTAFHIIICIQYCQLVKGIAVYYLHFVVSIRIKDGTIYMQSMSSYIHFVYIKMNQINHSILISIVVYAYQNMFLRYFMSFYLYRCIVHQINSQYTQNISYVHIHHSTSKPPLDRPSTAQYCNFNVILIHLIVSPFFSHAIDCLLLIRRVYQVSPRLSVNRKYNKYKRWYPSASYPNIPHLHILPTSYVSNLIKLTHRMIVYCLVQ